MKNAQKRSVILDGYPRSVIQAELFNKFLLQERLERPTIVRLTAPDDVVIQRLHMRLTCSKKECQAVYSLAHLGEQDNYYCTKCLSPLMRRPDDEVAAIAQRLKLYATYEHGLLDFYRTQQFPLIQLEAHHPIDKVFGTLINYLENRA